MVADPKRVMVLPRRKGIVSRMAGMDNLPRAKDNMGSLPPAKDSTVSNLAAMADHHQTNLLMAVAHRADMALPHPLQGIRVGL